MRIVILTIKFLIMGITLAAITSTWYWKTNYAITKNKLDVCLTKLDETSNVAAFETQSNTQVIALSKIISKMQPRLDKAIVNKISISILTVAKLKHIDPALLTAIIWQESKFDPLAKSSKGALGLMQINYSVWSKDNLFKGKLTNPYSLYWIDKNIETGATILNFYYKACNNDILCTLYAYNSGKKKLLNYSKYYEIPYVTRIMVKAYQIKTNLENNLADRDIKEKNH